LSNEAKQKIRLSMLGDKNHRFGKPGTCIGRKQTPEQIEKIKAARARQIITEETKRKLSVSLKKAYAEGRKRKEDLSWYIDGRHEGNRPIKQSFEYRIWREAVFTRDNWTCQNCKVRGGEIQAHHLKPQSLYNGQTLCRSCHLKTDTWGLRIDKFKIIKQ
jgi:5-methylcytosine-specific restriction endonuclease McrA